MSVTTPKTNLFFLSGNDFAEEAPRTTAPNFPTTTAPTEEAREQQKKKKTLGHQDEMDRYTIAELDSLIEKRAAQITAGEQGRHIESSRVITSEMLRRAPDGYFRQFFDEVASVEKEVQNKLTRDPGRSRLVNRAALEPTNKKLLDDAFLVLNNITNEKMLNKGLLPHQKSIVSSMVIANFLGLSYLDPLWNDRSIDEIICNGPYDIQIEIKGKLYRVHGCEFPDQKTLMNLMEKLFERVGRKISQTQPVHKARLHDRSRLHVTHMAVSPDGPNVNIRRHPEGYWSVQDMLDKGTASPELMHYIGNLIYKGASYCVISSTGGGKTTMLNALSGFYRDDERIVTIEDSLEMKPHPGKMLAAAMETRRSRGDSEAQDVDMRTLVQASTQMRPNIIIQGESTDSSAYDLCQALNTGHYGASTIHANTSELAVTRIASLVAQSGLTNIEGAYDLVAAAFDFIIAMKRLPDGTRKIASIDEVGMKPKLVNGVMTLPVKPIWVFKEDGVKDGLIQGHWEQVSELSQERRDAKLLDLIDDLSWEELLEISRLPDGVKRV